MKDRKYIVQFLLILFFISLLADSHVTTYFLNHRVHPFSEIMGWISFAGQGWIQALPCILLIFIGTISKKWSWLKKVGINTVYGLILSGVITQFIKHLIGRPRPSFVPETGIILGPTFARGFDSFPSGHATSAFAFASILSEYFPFMRIILYAYAMLVSFSRIYIRAHYLSDVIAGIAIGLSIGWFIVPSRWDDIKYFLRRRGVLLLILAIAFFMFFLNIGRPGLFDVDEAVYAESAREMVTTGDWITPHYNGANRYDKPILFYWLISSAYHIFGINEFSARFWSAFLGVTLAGVLYVFLKHFGSERFAIISSLIFITSMEVAILAHAAITDMTLTFFMTLSLLCFYTGYIEKEQKRRWYIAGYAASGLAVLTKGPVGLVIPGLIILIFLTIVKDLRRGLKDIFIPGGIGIFLFITLPWYGAEIWINGWEYINAFFIKHNITRYTGVISGHSGPIYYFVVVVLLAFFPWSIFIPEGIKKAFSSGHSLLVFAAVWFLTIFIFFSLSRTKLPGYIAPLSPAAAIIAGWVWNGWIGNIPVAFKKRHRIYSWSMLTYLILGIVGGMGFLSLPYYMAHSPYVNNRIGETIKGLSIFYTMGMVILGGVIISYISFVRQKGRIAFTIMAGMMMSVASILFLYVVPLVDYYMQTPLRTYAQVVKDKMILQNGELIIYDLNKPSLIFYSQHYATIVGGGAHEQLKKVLSTDKNLYIITKARRVSELRKMGLYLIDQKRGYALLERTGRNERRK